MKNILALLLILIFVSCETPYMITETITKDSTGKEVHTIVKKYADGTSTPVPQASVNVVTNPFWYWGTPYYYPRYYYTPSPRIVVPINPMPHYMPRGGRH